MSLRNVLTAFALVIAYAAIPELASASASTCPEITLAGEEDSAADPSGRRVGVRPGDVDDDVLERILREAPIVLSEEVGTGVTRPLRLTLEWEGQRYRALFKNVETPIQGNRREMRRLISISDRWQYEVAAYRLDRILDLRLVPVTVARTHEGSTGALQYWVDGLVSFKDIVQDDAEIGQDCERRAQINAMNVFDVLIHNVDRTQENMTFLAATGSAVLIDHSRAFRLDRGVPKTLEDMQISVTSAWKKRLESLDEDQVSQQLRPLMDRSQVSALLARVDLLLKMAEE